MCSDKELYNCNLEEVDLYVIDSLYIYIYMLTLLIS